MLIDPIIIRKVIVLFRLEEILNITCYPSLIYKCLYLDYCVLILFLLVLTFFYYIYLLFDLIVLITFMQLMYRGSQGRVAEIANWATS